MITVTDLVTYPIKSCAGIHPNEVRITPRGLQLDRDYMLVDDDNDFVSQRKVPELALVVPTIGATSIALAAPGMDTLEVPLEIAQDDEKLIIATVHDRPVAGQIVAEEINEWFTAFLPGYKDRERYRLLKVREDTPRYVKERYLIPDASNRVGFADGHSMLLATEPSLRALNAEMDEPVPMNRFRPNIVIDGEGLGPYDEDFWIQIQIGALSAFVVKGCDRCVVPDTDQETAVVGKSVRQALRSRKGANAYDEANTGVFFAQNLNHVYAPGVSIRLGDRVHVIGRSAEPNVLLVSARERRAVNVARRT
jgi:uncharacterized protein